MGQLLQNTEDGTVMLGQKQRGRLHFITVDERVTVEHIRWEITLEHSRSNIGMQKTGQLCLNTLDATVTVELRRWDNYVRREQTG